MSNQDNSSNRSVTSRKDQLSLRVLDAESVSLGEVTADSVAVAGAVTAESLSTTGTLVIPISVNVAAVNTTSIGQLVLATDGKLYIAVAVTGTPATDWDLVGAQA